MIKDGKKTIETRTWKTDYRGDILLCASKYPQSSISGKAFAIAKLVGVKPMVKDDVCKACCDMYPGAYSWVLNEVVVIEPFTLKGSITII